MPQQRSSADPAAVAEIAKRHGFSSEAAQHMLDAVGRGNGSMAQFNHPEFAGSGQWMRGGMTMVSDMFNNPLKSRVDALCSDLSALIAREAGGGAATEGRSSPSAPAQQPGASGDAGNSGNPGTWWPAGLDRPNSTGSQNDMRYAYFADARRLAVDRGGRVTVYDTLDHGISGVSQQQSGSATLRFSSQHGSVDLESLPVVSPGGSA